MKYLALIYAEDGPRPEPGSPESHAILVQWAKANKGFNEAGVMQEANPLQPITTATSLRIRDGKQVTSDGPFAETKERLGGYYLFDCRDLDHAIELASQIPAVHYGTIELRPIMQIPDAL